MHVKAAKVDPIKRRQDIERLRKYFIEEYKYGNVYALAVTLGCNFGLRAGDLLNLTYGSVRGEYLEVVEEKTHKLRRIYINGKAREAIADYAEKYLYLSDTAKFFYGQKGCTVGVKALHRLIKKGCLEIGLDGNYGSHTLRKTFAYHAYQYTNNMKLIKDLFNHSDTSVTRAYVGDIARDGNIYDCSENEIYAALNL